MEDAFHCNFASVVVCVDRFWVMRPAGWVARLSGGQEGFDSFVSEDEQRSHRSEPGWERLVAAGGGGPPGGGGAAGGVLKINGAGGGGLAWACFCWSRLRAGGAAGGLSGAARARPSTEEAG